MTGRFAHVSLKDAKVQAFKAPLVDFPVGFRGGPVLEAAEHQGFRHHRWGKPSDHFSAAATYDVRLEGEYVYAGPLYQHFGHFMAEMVHRIIPARALGLKGRFLFVTTSDWDKLDRFDDLPRYLNDILAFLDLTANDITILDRHGVVETLHVVEPGSHLGATPKPGYLEALRDYAAPRLDAIFPGVERPRKLYVSRSAFSKAGGILGESYLEAELRKEGFALFHPERHGFAEQMDHYRKAECVIFTSGSACHGVELLGAGMLNRMVLIPRLESHGALFRRVLEPRAASFELAAATRFLGTVTVNPRVSQPRINRGVTLYDTDRLLSYFRSSGLARLESFSRSAYRRRAVFDLLRYFREMAQEWRCWSRLETTKLLKALFSA